MWPFPLQLWQITPLVRPVEATDEEILARAGGTADLCFSSGAGDDDGAAERGLDTKRAADRAGGGGAEFLVPDDVLVSLKLLFGFGCCPCNSFSANIESWNNLLREL